MWWFPQITVPHISNTIHILPSRGLATGTTAKTTAISKTTNLKNGSTILKTTNQPLKEDYVFNHLPMKIYPSSSNCNCGEHHGSNYNEKHCHNKWNHELTQFVSSCRQFDHPKNQINCEFGQTSQV
jgi:hypothetical protein